MKAVLKRFPPAVRAVRALRAAAAQARRVAGWPVRGALIRRYLRSHAVGKLQLGAGTNPLPGWLNTDGYPASLRVLALDARRRLPFPDRAFDYIFSEHHIEHMAWRDGRAMLHECHRVLRPGGRFRVATPDLDVLLELRSPRRTPAQDQYVRWIVDTFAPEIGVHSGTVVLNHAFRSWGHQFIYDEPTLRCLMTGAGFVDVVRYPMGVSDDDHLRGIEHHGVAVGNVEMNQFETMVLEGRRDG